MKILCSLLFVLVFVLPLPSVSAPRPVIADAYYNPSPLPFYFEANSGQVDSTFDFISRCGEYTLYLRDGEATFIPHLGDKESETVFGSVLRL